MLSDVKNYRPSSSERSPKVDVPADSGTGVTKLSKHGISALRFLLLRHTDEKRAKKNDKKIPI